MNALGKAVAMSPKLVIAEGNDNLKRKINVGWHGILKYGVIDQNALEVITSA
jgi:hypothetical protein